MNGYFCERWESTRLASLFIENTQKNDDFTINNALQFKYGSLVQKKQYDLTDDLIATYKKYTIVKPNDIMINGLNLNYDFITKRVALVSLAGIITSAYICLRPRNGVYSKFYSYFLKALDSMKVFNGMGTGIRLTLSYDLMKNMMLPVPPRAEQDQIVRYLDWQVSKINRLIAAKKNQLELLEDVLLTTIQQSISLEPERDIDCLLDTVHSWIPGGWSCPLLGQLLDNIEQGWSPNAGEELNDPNQWHVLTLSAIKHGTYYPEANKPIDIHESVPEKLEVRHGDILMTRSNTRSLVGDVCLVESSVERLIFSDLVYRLNVRKQLVYPRYLMYYLLSSFSRLQIERLAKGSSGTMPKLSHADIRRLRVILPSLGEQKLISAKLDKAVQSIEQASNAILKQIECTLEYRTRLISDVVTGQVDVRGIEVPDFEKVEDETTKETDNEEGETYEE